MSTTTTQQAPQPELLQYLAVERVSRQWADFLSIFSGELAAQLTDTEYRELLVRMGGKFATLNPLPVCAELNDIQAAANALWAGLQWGYAQFADHGQIYRSLTMLARCLLACSSMPGGWWIFARCVPHVDSRCGCASFTEPAPASC